MELLLETLRSSRDFILAGHFLGIALGLGGATVTDVLFFNFLKDFRISRKEADILRVLSLVIVGALLLLLLTGLALYALEMERLNDSPAFLVKMIIIMVLTVNGMPMHRIIMPRMIGLSFHPHENKEKHAALERMRRLAFMFGGVSFSSWYFVFFLSMLKRLLPSSVGTVDLLLLYALLVVTAVICSKIMEKQMVRKASRSRQK